MKTDAIENRPWPEIRTQSRPREGFTLIGLLAVVVILAILTVLLLPALARTKAQAQAIQCLNNCNLLGKAWMMYAGDNNNRFVNNFGMAGGTYAYRTWCVDNMDWTTSQQNTNTFLLQRGQLGPYMAKSVGSYKCPADHYLSTVQVQAGFLARVRSYSMNCFLGLFSPCPTCAGDSSGNPGSGTDYTWSGQNESSEGWPQFLKLSNIPQPSQIYVFLDEHPDSINDGYFQDGDQCTASDPKLWTGSDVPASTHNGACGFSFCDAHAEIHKWQVPGTVVPVTTKGVTDPICTGGNYTDRIWLCSHACVLPPGQGN